MHHGFRTCLFVYISYFPLCCSKIPDWKNLRKNEIIWTLVLGNCCHSSMKLMSIMWSQMGSRVWCMLLLFLKKISLGLHFMECCYPHLQWVTSSIWCSWQMIWIPNTSAAWSTHVASSEGWIIFKLAASSIMRHLLKLTLHHHRLYSVFSGILAWTPAPLLSLKQFSEIETVEQDSMAPSIIDISCLREQFHTGNAAKFYYSKRRLAFLGYTAWPLCAFQADSGGTLY